MPRNSRATPRTSDAGAGFARLVADLDYPMLLVTTRAGGSPEGCLVGFSSQCSINPPRFLVGLSNKNRTFRAAMQAPALAVHLIPEEAGELAELFGGETQDEIDKFTRCRWHPGRAGDRRPLRVLRARPGRGLGTAPPGRRGGCRAGPAGALTRVSGLPRSLASRAGSPRL